MTRRIFDLCAAGQGLRTIARTLNDDRVGHPRGSGPRAAARVAAPPANLETRRHTLETALAHMEAALARLTQAVADGGAVATLVQAIGDQERRRQTLQAELSELERRRVVPLNVAQLKARVREKSEEWQAVLRNHAPIARQMVRKLVEGRIVFTPDPEAGRYRFTMPGTLENFFSGIVPLAMASPTGQPVLYLSGPLSV